MSATLPHEAQSTDDSVTIVGAGPAGLMAAEVLSAAGVTVNVYDAMPSVGRKFLLAGIGGLNLTHAEAWSQFVRRYGSRQHECAHWLRQFDAQAIRDWVHGLGLATFVGSSQRVFPTDMKAAPLLRAWLHRLRHPQHGQPVRFHMRHRWNGGLVREDHAYRLSFDSPNGPVIAQSSTVVLALGGGSWARLGSDGAWQEWLSTAGIDIAPLQAANCGFHVAGGWSAHLQSRFAGTPVKGTALHFEDFARKGEFVLTEHGVEGSLIYAVSSIVRDAITRHGAATLYIDLKPDWPLARVEAELQRSRGSRSLSSQLKAKLHLSPVHLALLHETLADAAQATPARLAAHLKALPLTLDATRPLDEAISSAGGVKLEGLDPDLMALRHPGLFMAGEMLDWEAPTGGYLLSACFASARVAAQGVLRFRQQHPGA